MQRKQVSSIEKNRCEDLVKELSLRGCSVSEIMETVKKRRGIVLSRMSISRYLRKVTDRRLEPSQIRDKLHELKEESTVNSERLLVDIDRLYNDLEFMFEKSKLPSSERSIYLQTLRGIREAVVDSKINQMMTYEAIEINTRAIKVFLIEWSNHLCPQCRRSVAETVKAFQEGNKG